MSENYKFEIEPLRVSDQYRLYLYNKDHSKSFCLGTFFSQTNAEYQRDLVKQWIDLGYFKPGF